MYFAIFESGNQAGAQKNIKMGMHVTKRQHTITINTTTTS